MEVKGGEKMTNAKKRVVSKKAPSKRTVKKTTFHPIRFFISMLFLGVIIFLGFKALSQFKTLQSLRQGVVQKINAQIHPETDQAFQQNVPQAYTKEKQINDDINAIITSGAMNTNSTTGGK